MKFYGEWRYRSILPCASALDGDEWSHPTKRDFSTHCMGGWVCPRTGLDAVEMRKILYPCTDSPAIRFVAVAIPTELSRLHLHQWLEYF
jgi:hypothetical protein